MKVISQTNHHPVENHCFSGLPIFVMESELPAELKVINRKTGILKLITRLGAKLQLLINVTFTEPKKQRL